MKNTLLNKFIYITVFAVMALCSLQALAVTETIDPALTPQKILNCAMPVEREDGTALALDEIAEVRFYSGTKTGDYINTENNTTCQLVIDTTAKTDGSYFYVVTAVDTDGRESLYSPEEWVLVVKRVRPPRSPTWL